MTPDERVRRMRDVLRDRAARRRLADHLIPGLPVDADPPELRRKAANMGDTISGVMESLLSVPSEFYDSIVSQWAKLFPGTPARPISFEEDARTFKLVLAVPNAGAAFALRAQMPRIRRTLKALDKAPKKKLVLILRVG